MFFKNDVSTSKEKNSKKTKSTATLVLNVKGFDVNPEVRSKLCVSPQTVKTYRGSAFYFYSHFFSCSPLVRSNKRSSHKSFMPSGVALTSLFSTQFKINVNILKKNIKILVSDTPYWSEDMSPGALASFINEKYSESAAESEKLKFLAREAYGETDNKEEAWSQIKDISAVKEERERVLSRLLEAYEAAVVLD